MLFLATTGVLLTIAAQRREQRRSRLISRQQIASAFIGELTVILDELKHEIVGSVLRKALNDIQTGTGKVPVTTGRLLNTAKYYDNNPGNVGVFPNLLPQELTRFYSDLHAFATCLDRYSSAAEHAITEGTLPATTSTHWIIYSIQDALKKLDSCLKRGRVLIAELEVIRNAKVD